MTLTGQVAIVTGAGGGLGRAHALFLATQGARLVVNDPGLDETGASRADAVMAEILAAGGEAIASRASVTDAAAVEAMVAEAIARFGRIDILINNAGILRDKSFANMSLDDFRLVVDVHLMGSVICSKAVWAIMRQQNRGRIVMTTSSSGLYGSFGQANYGAAKMALVGLMQTLALEGTRYDIRVNCLAPTAATQMTDGLMPEAMLALLKPELVSPGLLKLVGDDAPTRAILCAGAGHFATANVTLTQGVQIGGDAGAAQAVVDQWEAIGDRAGEIVPGAGMVQPQRELAAAGYVAAAS